MNESILDSSIPKNFFTQIIGREIQRLRKENTISGTKLANKLGISQQQYSRYERGINTISVDTLLHILYILECDLDSFFAYLRYQIERDNLPAYTKFKPLFNKLGTYDEIEQYFLKTKE
ncbi:helix-turn-helix domain-containing protein [Providencia vermicola]|uniref:Helix-turn-helix domain-containing protein n=1 Tax=Providencia vermicola TaxID=333965 RepID=A0AAX3RZG3_9GAMM|nr:MULTISPECIES: helix-turn-helix transcriptional regulator [Providencia]ELX8378472.1 helix-turn-helix transcriptional regulator [Providencia stuartii]EMD5257679.1 helix-turn-helix transcriptional regulator [Providencia stuartii]USB35516.1 helix-turn-helix domain-containing protein [Providencia vermicola]WFC08022.1 helix-turn-helix transcriptional regulator [Providencia vermicola]